MFTPYQWVRQSACHDRKGVEFLYPVPQSNVDEPDGAGGRLNLPACEGKPKNPHGV